MGAIRFVSLRGDSDGDVVREEPWDNDPMDVVALRRAVIAQTTDLDGQVNGLRWTGFGALAVRAIDDNGKLGARYTWWDFEREHREIVTNRKRHSEGGR